MKPTAESPRAVGWFPFAFLAAGLALFVFAAQLGWRQPILDLASFRQTQTAISADHFVRDGFKLAYETPVLGAPWSIPFEFPTYQFLVAALTRTTGLPLDQAGRAVSVVFALGALALLFVFARRLAGTAAAGTFAAALACCVPAFLYYSRAFLIESTALCFALGLLVAAQDFLIRPRLAILPALFLAGLLAALTKATTYAVALVAISTLTLASLPAFLPHLRATGRAITLAAAALAALAVPFAAGLAWVRWTDALKQRNPLAAFTTSTALHDWNFGTWAQRLDRKTWARLFELGDSALTGTFWLWLAAAVLVALAAVRFVPRERRPALAVAALVALPALAAGPLVFTNLYFVHDYYFYAATLYLPLLLGTLSGQLWTHASPLLRCSLAAALLAIAAAGVRGYVNAYLPAQTRTDPALLELAAKIDALTPTDGVLLIEGSEWDSALPYYAHRRALTNREALDPRAPRLRDALARLDHPLVAIVARLWARTDWNHLARQATGLPQTFERVFASPAGDLYRVVPAGQTPQFASTWQQAGFAPLPRFFCGPAAFDLSQLAGQPAIFAHAPSVILLTRPADARELTISFGLREDAYSGQYKTDGVTFIVDFHPDSAADTRLFSRRLDPAAVAADRGLQSATVTLPAGVSGTLSLRTETGPNESFDWSLWRDVRLR